MGIHPRMKVKWSIDRKCQRTLKDDTVEQPSRSWHRRPGCDTFIFDWSKDKS
jgi:hypothetical protein